jgi:hypothetical protein
MAQAAAGSNSNFLYVPNIKEYAHIFNVGFQVPSSVVKKIFVFWDITLRSLLKADISEEYISSVIKAEE